MSNNSFEHAGKMVPPEGYVMVPKELTPEMEAAYVDKAEEQDPFRTHWLNRHGYRAMIAAARSQPTTEESLVVAGAQPVREPLTQEEGSVAYAIGLTGGRQ